MSPAPGWPYEFYSPMLVLGLCEPDAAKIIDLVCPSLVAYPNAMATTVAIFNRRRPHVSGYFRKQGFFSRVKLSVYIYTAFSGSKNRRFSKTVPRVKLFIKKPRLIVFSGGRPFNSWGGGGGGWFWKKISFKRLSKEKKCMQHKCNRKLMGKKGKKNILPTKFLEKRILDYHPSPQELNGRPLRGRTKTDVFEYDDVIHHTADALLGMIPSSHSFGIFVWMSENDSIRCV